MVKYFLNKKVIFHKNDLFFQLVKTGYTDYKYEYVSCRYLDTMF